MKRTFLLQALAGAVLLFGITVYAGRLLGAAGPDAHLDLGGRHPATVPAELRRLLRGLDGELTATLFVSGRERMPSHLREVEATARALLEEMEDAAGGRFSYRVIDPGLSGPAGARYAASRRASPIRVRRVVDDAESQAEIWSSLVFSREGKPRREDVLIQGIENAHLPHLARLVAARLSAGESAPQASFALSAPPGYGKFPRYLSQHGPVVEIDVDAGGFIPRDVDVLFWLEPRRVTRQHIAALRRFLASGRTAVLAGSAYRVRYSAGEEGEVRFRVEGMGGAWERLLEPFGLEPVADLLMDRNAGPVTVPVDGVEGEVEAPFHLRNLPAFRDFRPFRTPARGGLSFTAASPLRVDPRRVAAAGYQAHVAATTTEHAWVRPLPRGGFGPGGPVRGPARAQAEPDGPAHPGGPVGGASCWCWPRPAPSATRSSSRPGTATPSSSATWRALSPIRIGWRGCGSIEGCRRACRPCRAGPAWAGVWRWWASCPCCGRGWRCGPCAAASGRGAGTAPHGGRRSRPEGRWQRWPWCSWRCAVPCPACTGT